MTTPQSHLEEGRKLTADAEVDFYTLILVGGTTLARFTNGATLTWQGLVYDALSISMTGDHRSADDEESRPMLRLMNPAGIFNKPALEGQLDRATIRRRRVLRTHAETNVNIYVQRMWYVERVKELISGEYVGLELRPMTDGPNFQIPYRKYMPPTFPTVSL